MAFKNIIYLILIYTILIKFFTYKNIKNNTYNNR